MTKGKRTPTRLPALTDLQAIKEALDVRLGRRGDKRDAAVTFRDLEGSGAFRYNPTGNGGSGSLGMVPPSGETDGVDLETWVPSAPEGFKATSMFGGILIEWDWPPHFGAIGHTEVYRATTNDATKRQLVTVGDMLTYFDEIGEGDEQEYFYWIRFRSLGNKVGPYAGPVSAVAQRPVKDIIDEVEADIKATDAYKDITADVVPFDEQFADDITRLEDRVAAIKSRVTDRIAAIKQVVADKRTAIKTALGARVLDPNSITDEHVDTYLNMAGVNAQAALAVADTANASAAIANEGVVKLETLDVDESSALYTRFSNIDLAVGSAQGEITNILSLDIDENSALYTRFTGVEASVGDVSGRIKAVEDLTLDEHSALYTKLDSASVSAAAGVAKADSILKLSADPNSVFAEFVEAMTVTKPDGSYATFQETKKLADDLSGEYSIKLDSNGNVAGFGLYNTPGDGSSFAVRADKFYVVDSNGEGSNDTPFIVKDGNTYIRSAYIEDAFVDNLNTYAANIATAKIANATIDWAKISDVEVANADIKNGAITNAKIGDAEVDTLKIGQNAVTVPSGYYYSGAATTAPGADAELASTSIYMSHDGRINFFFSCRQGYTEGLRWTEFDLRIKVGYYGIYKSYYKGSSGSFQDFVSFSHTMNVSAGNRVYAKVIWNAEDGTVTAGYRNLTITGMKKTGVEND